MYHNAFSNDSHDARAFTLIELLVVISIISLLISILLPALGGAKKAAQATRCLTQLRQNQMGLFAYANDYKGFMPPALPIGGISSGSWTARLVDHDYVSTNQIARCPTLSPEQYVDTSKYRSYGMRIPSSFVSRVASGAADYSRELNIQAVDSYYGAPSSYVHLGDTYYKYGSGPSQYFYFYGQEVVTVIPPFSGPYLHARHLNAANVTFLDGHGAARTEPDLTDASLINWKRFSVITAETEF
jgi:prepilin-type N-terminal cleavage/methylation domain-containing protein/prepilin-type processing-associated H-X9-DG protein